MYFSPQGEKIPKELLRLPPQTPILLLGSTYTRLEGVAVLAKLAQATGINWKAIYTLLKRSAKINRTTMQCSALQGNLARAGSTCHWEARPQTQGARRVSAFRCDVHKHGGG